MLTKHSERAFQAVALLQRREFVGTESKFRDILDNNTQEPHPHLTADETRVFQFPQPPLRRSASRRQMC